MPEIQPRPLWGASARVVMATALVASLGVLRDVLVARQWGVGAATDAYALVFGVVNAVAMSLSASVLLVAVPRIAALSVRHAGVPQVTAMLRPFANLIGVAVAASLLLQTLGWLRPGWIYLRPLTVAEEASAAALTRAVALLPLGAVLATILGSAMRIHGHHGLASSIVGLRGAGGAVAVLLVAGAGVVGVGAGTTAGVALEVVVLAAWLVRMRSRARAMLAVEPASSARAVWPSLVVPLLPWAMFLTDKLIVSQGGAGEPAVLEFSYKLFAMPHTLLAMSLVTVAFVEISKSAARSDARAEHTASTSTLLALVVGMGLVAVFVAATASGMVRLVYGHGAVTESDLAHMASCLTRYALGLMPLGIGALVARLCFLHGQGKVVAAVALALIATNATLDAIAYRWRGLTAIPLVTAAVSWIWAVALLTLPAVRAHARALLGELSQHRGALTRLVLVVAIPSLSARLLLRPLDGSSLGNAVAVVVPALVWAAALGLGLRSSPLRPGGRRI